MSGIEIRIGTRGSALALAQAGMVAAALEAVGARPRLVLVETAGDRRAADTAWGEGAFVAAIEGELLAGRVDVAVHSAKDVPTEEDPRLRIGAYLQRADPRDALVVRAGIGGSLAELPLGARIGTDSPRRTGFLLARRPDLEVRPLHGNVDTRLRRLDEGRADALVLACAGLDRLGLGDRIAERLDPEIIMPAPGQGAVAVQVRSDDEDALRLVALIDHVETRVAVEAERAFLAASGGGCRSPIGALATVIDGRLEIVVGDVRIDGSHARFTRGRAGLDGGRALAADLAAALGADPAGGLAAGPNTGHQGDRLRVLVTRAASQADPLLSALRTVGLEPLPVPTIAVELAAGGGALDAALRRLKAYAWVVVTSANGARAVLAATERVTTSIRATRWSAIGTATRDVLEGEGVAVEFQPAVSTSAALGAGLPVRPGDKILLVRGDLADDSLPEALRARGAVVEDVIGYQTIEAPVASGPLLRGALADGPLQAVVFTSGSTVRGLLELGRREGLDLIGLPAVCIGPETAAAAERAGFRVVETAGRPEAWVLAEAVAKAVARIAADRDGAEVPAAATAGAAGQGEAPG